MDLVVEVAEAPPFPGGVTDVGSKEGRGGGGLGLGLSTGRHVIGRSRGLRDGGNGGPDAGLDVGGEEGDVALEEAVLLLELLEPLLEVQVEAVDGIHPLLQAREVALLLVTALGGGDLVA